MSNIYTPTINSNVYHERQIRELCALHTLNNLFQERGFFTKLQLDEICKQLSPNEWINPHRSMLGLGNYDINVIMSALENRGYEATWFDKRKNPSSIHLSHSFGFILNVPIDYTVGVITLPLKRRHWIAIKKINGKYWNLDSKLGAPHDLGNEDDLISYFTNELQGKDKELFIVTKMIRSFSDPNQQNGTVQIHNDCMQNDHGKSDSQSNLPLTFSNYTQNDVEFSLN